MSNAMVEMPLDELDGYRNTIRELQDKLARLAEEKIAAEKVDPNDRVEMLVDTVLKSLPIVGFATGNLDPSTIRRWPWAELRAFATALETAPGLPYLPRELALELHAFANEAERVERGRMAVPPAAVADEDPETAGG